jgi:hypothetical protein
MRQYSEHATPVAKALLDQLVAKPSPHAYRTAMEQLGAEMAGIVGAKLGNDERILLVCTNEDADFLVKGLLGELQRQGHTHIAVACFWNDRVRIAAAQLDVAPIIRSYVEPTEHVDAFVVVKSVISSACVVRTNITELVDEKQPRRILVVSPVILKGSTENLASEFDTDIAKRFEYFWFAQDDERKNDGEVVPGIGGSVYELLGIGTNTTKNNYVPELVATRRDFFHTEPQ